MIDVIIPTYGRPHHLKDLCDQIDATPDTNLIFVVHENDNESRDELISLQRKYVVDHAPASGVNATNRGFQAVTSEWFVIGQDDIQYHDGWLKEGQRVAQETGATVIGFNDGMHEDFSVSWLINKFYADTVGMSIERPGVIFNPDYTKNYSDNELNDTAKYRGAWAWAREALTEHMHPGFGKGKLDETYTRPEVDCEADYSIYMARRELWS
jgi:glycosyltransferase involved in cell wall biosynthesis